VNAPVVTPPSGDYLVVAVGKGNALGAVSGPFAERDQALRALRRSPGQAILVRGSSVLEGVRIPSASAMAVLRQRVAEHGVPAPSKSTSPAAPVAPTPAPAAPVAEPEETTERAAKPLRIARAKPVPTGHCGGCGEAAPAHSIVCPVVPAVLPGERAAGPVVPVVAAAAATDPAPEAPARRCPFCGEPGPDHLLGCDGATRPSPRDPTPDDETNQEPTMPKKTPTTKTAARASAATTSALCCANGCEELPAGVGEKTRPELARFCKLHRQRAYERAGRWRCTLAAAAQTVEDGVSKRPEGAAPSCKGQRPAKVAPKKRGRPPKARAATPAVTLTDPSDVLAAEFRALLDRYLGARLDRAAIEGIVDERVVSLVRRALAVPT
jgi:hypothetical protein